MKKLFSVFAFVCSTLAVNAQVVRDADVPQGVKSKMTEMFPAASAVVWSRDMPGFISSDFVQNKTKMSATFSTSGSWVSTEIFVKQDSLPAAANQYLMTTYADGKVTQCAKSQSVSQKTFECRVKSKTAGEFDIVFDTQGNVLMKTAVEND